MGGGLGAWGRREDCNKCGRDMEGVQRRII